MATRLQAWTCNQLLLRAESYERIEKNYIVKIETGMFLNKCYVTCRYKQSITVFCFSVMINRSSFDLI